MTEGTAAMTAETVTVMTKQEMANALALNIRRCSQDVQRCRKALEGLTDRWHIEEHVTISHCLMSSKDYLERAYPRLARLVNLGIIPMPPNDTWRDRVRGCFGLSRLIEVPFDEEETAAWEAELGDAEPDFDDEGDDWPDGEDWPDGIPFGF